MKTFQTISARQSKLALNTPRRSFFLPCVHKPCPKISPVPERYVKQMYAQELFSEIYSMGPIQHVHHPALKCLLLGPGCSKGG